MRHQSLLGFSFASLALLSPHAHAGNVGYDLVSQDLVVPSEHTPYSKDFVLGEIRVRSIHDEHELLSPEPWMHPSDSTLEQDKIFASDPDEGNEFGVSVHADGTTIVAGARSYDEKRGAAYVYERREINGRMRIVQTAKLLPPGDATSSQFGTSVAVYGDTLAVGAPKFGDFGAVFLYQRSERDSWTLVRTVIPTDAISGAEFGYSVSLGQETLAVGAYRDGDESSVPGVVYMFEVQDGGWTQTQKLRHSQSAKDDEFGRSVDLGPGILAVGAWSSDVGALDSGMVYLYARGVDGTWSLSQSIANPSAQQDARFGRSVSLSQDALIVGAWKDSTRADGAGAVYVYHPSSEAQDWQLQQTVTAPDAAMGDAFGFSVSVDEGSHRLAIGAMAQDDMGQNSGSVYLYEQKEDGAFHLEAQLYAEDGERQDTFGRAVAITEDLVVAGARGNDDFGSFSGSAYVFAARTGALPAPVSTALTGSLLGLGLFALGRRRKRRVIV